ncbi:MAG: NifU family protein [Chthoniobacterales bacterium]|nr:NifU family protein [Chthoniobacterales bacterium]
MDKPNTKEFQERLGRVEELIATLESTPDAAVREQVRELIQSLLELHGNGLERILSVIYDANGAGMETIDQLGRDHLVSGLLLLHGLHPLDLETRVRNAIEEVKPRLGLHGGSVELLGVSPEGRVHLKLQGNCHECPSSRLTLRFSIEEALNAAAPDLTGLDVEGLPEEQPKAMPEGKVITPKFNDCPLPNGNGRTAEIGVSI